MTSFNKNLLIRSQGTNIDNVSYVITAFNKKLYTSSIITALANEGGKHKREYIVVDDGSYDGTSGIYKLLKDKLPGPIKIIRQKNMGASASTNRGVRNARYPWVRLVDGDDMVTRFSTHLMLKIAKTLNLDFVYGDLGDVLKDNIYEDCSKTIKHKVLNRKEGLKVFIKNCPANSSSILVKKGRYLNAGGCNENFVSPDQLLFLRLFNEGSGVHLIRKVALVPCSSENRLSSQVKRSRYESVLAILTFLSENYKLDKTIKKWAYKRTLSRSYNYHRIFGGSRLSFHYLRYVYSKLYFPKNYLSIIKKSLSCFTESGMSNKPESWKTGATKLGLAKKREKF